VAPRSSEPPPRGVGANKAIGHPRAPHRPVQVDSSLAAIADVRPRALRRQSERVPLRLPKFRLGPAYTIPSPFCRRACGHSSLEV